MKMRYGVAITVVLAAFVAYQIKPVVHDGIEEKMKYRFWYSYATLAHTYVGNIRAFFASSPEEAISEWTNGINAGSRFTAALVPTSCYGPGVTRRETTFDGTPVFIYTPARRSSHLYPAFIYIHGGGLTLWSAEYYDIITRKLSFELDSIVISIDYRLAPEHPFPVPLEDTLRAVKWFLKNAKKYGVDPQRIAVGGDSAGGYLSALVTNAIFDDKTLPDLKFQVLIYPWTQVLDMNYPSYQKYEKDFDGKGPLSSFVMAYFSAMHIWGKAGVAKIADVMINNHTSSSFKKSALYKKRMSHELLPSEFRDPEYYNGGTADNEGSDEIWNAKKDVFLDPNFSPHFRENFSGLPPTYLQTVGYDPLRDEGVIYGKLLQADGVDVVWDHYEKGFHGIFHVGPLVQFKLGLKMFDDVVEYAKSRL